MIVTVNSN